MPGPEVVDEGVGSRLPGWRVLCLVGAKGHTAVRHAVVAFWGVIIGFDIEPLGEAAGNAPQEEGAGPGEGFLFCKHSRGSISFAF